MNKMKTIVQTLNSSLYQGTLSRPGATSGPLDIMITGDKEPGKSYTATVNIDLKIGDNTHDSLQYDITIIANE